MPFIVEITLSEQAWDQALVEAGPLIGRHIDDPDELGFAEQADILRTVMRAALACHHRWLEDRGIGAVISPAKESERTFDFEFACGPDALLFVQEFNGKLRAGSL